MEESGIIDTTIKEIDTTVKSILGLQGMSVCIVCRPGMGGSGIMGTSVASGLAARNHEVHLIAYRKPFALREKRVKNHFIAISREQALEHFPIIMSAASKIYDVVKKNSIDIINVHYAIPYSTASYLAREMFKSEGRKMPIVTTVHGTDVHTIGLRKEFKNIVRFTLKSSDGITAVSEYLAKQMANKFDLDNEVKVIHNFIDTEKFRKIENPALRKKLAKGKKIIMHASNFRGIKNVIDILDAFRIVRKTIPCRLLLVGDGPEMALVKRRARRYKLMEDIIFTGPRKDMERFYSLADVFVLASSREGFGLAVAEAMACQTPVVSTRSGGVSEIIDEGKNGLMTDVGDVVELADKITEILQNQELAENLAEEGRKKVLKNFTAEKIIPEYENYYSRIVLS